MDEIIIKGNEVEALTPEGQTATMKVPDFVEALAPRRFDTGDMVWPDGVKAVQSQGDAVVLVHQSAPRVYNFRWIAKDSEAPFGKGTKYRTVRIALPYLVIFVLYVPDERGRLQLSSSNEAFFRTKPITDLERDELFFPALLNCSRFDPPEGHPLSWICTQHLDRAPLMREMDEYRRIRMGFAALMKCLVETGFNYSSEMHEASSWYSESKTVSKEIATVEAWEKASAKDPLFALDVPWLKTGLSVNNLIRRIFSNQRCARRAARHAGDLARIVMNRGHSKQS